MKPLRGRCYREIEKTSKAKSRSPFSWCAPNRDTKSPLARLAVMEYDIRPHEAYDVTIAALFILAMLILTVLVFVLA